MSQIPIELIWQKLDLHIFKFFIIELYEKIHHESIRKQLLILENNKPAVNGDII